MGTLQGHPGIAGAVAAEIRRIEQHPDLACGEGAAYKAAWDRRGSHWLNHCNAFMADCDLTRSVVFTRANPYGFSAARRAGP